MSSSADPHFHSRMNFSNHQFIWDHYQTLSMHTKAHYRHNSIKRILSILSPMTYSPVTCKVFQHNESHWINMVCYSVWSEILISVQFNFSGGPKKSVKTSNFYSKTQSKNSSQKCINCMEECIKCMEECKKCMQNQNWRSDKSLENLYMFFLSN
jgi:hypothetical protein